MAAAGAAALWRGARSLALALVTASLSLFVGVTSASAAEVQVATSGNHACAVLSSGRIACWGTGALGAEGVKTSATPVQVQGITDATQVTTSSDQSCARLSSGHIECWGENGSGELGDGETSSSATPVEVHGIADATEVASAGGHSCAVLSTGHVECWGYNGNGQLGIGSPDGPEKCGAQAGNPCSRTPMEVPGITDATQVAAGPGETCVVLSSGHLDCWGSNSTGQLGDGNITNAETPVEVDNIRDASNVAVGAGTSGGDGEGTACAVLSSGHVDCWGKNGSGQLGDGSLSGPEKCFNEWYSCSTVPVEVQGVTGASEVAAGSGHVCALLTTGVVDCWGLDKYGQLGDDGTQSADTPVQAGSNKSATQIAAGAQRSCAVLSGGHIDCWGFERTLEEIDWRDTPVEAENLSSATQVAGGSAYTCAALSTGHIDCWGSGEQAQLGDGYRGSSDMPVAVEDIANATEVAAGDIFACALQSSGLVECWGNNESGELGDGAPSGRESCEANACSTTPVEVHGVTNASGIAAAGLHSCAVLSSGHVECWGSNEVGQLGNGTTSDGTSAVEAQGVTDAIQVAAGGRHSCALLSTGHVDCWGSNLSGQLGDGTSSGPEKCQTGRSKQGEQEYVTCSTIPVEVQGLGNATQIALGGADSCALLSTGHVACWGANERGQLGDGEAGYATHDTPGEVHGITNATQIALGAVHSCALLSTGHIDCWGWNGKGQLGNGEDGVTPAVTPVEVRGIANATQVAAGSEHTCAALSTGHVDCWGHDAWGQLGDGTPWGQLPAEVLGIPLLASVVSGNASSLTTASATVSGTVNPGGLEASGCEFEFGPTSSYGSSVPCSTAPGSGTEAVRVTAALSGLSSDTAYHFRISATNEEGTAYGADTTFTTPHTSASGETAQATVPATATDGGLSIRASGGTGVVTVGSYGVDLGGTPLASGNGDELLVDRGEGSTFARIEYEDCELHGARMLWWDDPASGWEPLAEPAAVYDESSGCITVTATASSRPSIAQLSEAQLEAGPSATEEYGKCVAANRGHFEDSGCTKEDFKKKKGGGGTYRGSYEWLAAPNDCYQQKPGHFGNGGCTVESFKENRRTHERRYTGGYEQGSNAFTGTGTAATIEAVGLAPIECQASTVAGTQRAPDQDVLQITFTGCRSEGAKCTSRGQLGGTVLTEPLESYSYEEGSGYITALGGSPIASFECTHGTLTLSGNAGGPLSAPVNTALTGSKSTFAGGLGEQDLELEDQDGAVRVATLTTTLQITNTQATELRAKPH